MIIEIHIFCLFFVLLFPIYPLLVIFDKRLLLTYVFVGIRKTSPFERFSIGIGIVCGGAVEKESLDGE